jgi:hypothetical protein
LKLIHQYENLWGSFATRCLIQPLRGPISSNWLAPLCKHNPCHKLFALASCGGFCFSDAVSRSARTLTGQAEYASPDCFSRRASHFLI